jgi:hypothetical protein
MIIEKQYGVECLILSGSRDISIYGQMRQKGFDFRLSHFIRMPFAVEQDKPFYPGCISLFRAD